MSQPLPPSFQREPEECAACGGSGEVSEDRARGHEHYTVEVECPDCEGSGSVERDDFDDSRESPLAAPATTPIDDRFEKGGVL